MADPIYKTKSGVLTNVPSTDPSQYIDPNDVTNDGYGSTAPRAPSSWEGQGLLDSAKQTLADTAPESATLDHINALLFPRAAAAKSSHPALLQNVVSSKDYADLEQQLQQAQETDDAQHSLGGRIISDIPSAAIPAMAALATPFVGPEITIPAAAAATTALDLAKSHYHDANAPQNLSNYLGDVGTSMAAPALTAAGESALRQAPALLRTPGLIPGAVGALHGYSRNGVLGAMEEGGLGYAGGIALDKLTPGVSALRTAAGMGGAPAAEEESGGFTPWASRLPSRVSREVPGFSYTEAPTYAPPREGYEPFKPSLSDPYMANTPGYVRGPIPEAPSEGFVSPNMPEAYAPNTPGYTKERIPEAPSEGAWNASRESDYRAGFSPAMIEKLNPLPQQEIRLPAPSPFVDPDVATQQLNALKAAATPSTSAPSAVFKGFQEDPGGGEVPLFDIQGGPSHGSTVTEDSLTKLGIDVPAVPTNPNRISADELRQRNTGSHAPEGLSPFEMLKRAAFDRAFQPGGKYAKD